MGNNFSVLCLEFINFHHPGFEFRNNDSESEEHALTSIAQSQSPDCALPHF